MSLLQPVGYDRPDAGRAGRRRPSSSTPGTCSDRRTRASRSRRRARRSSSAAISAATAVRCCPIRRRSTSADVLLVESTYGDRAARGRRRRRAAGAASSRDTAERGGKVIIPAFALGRVEELLYWIQRLENAQADSGAAGLRRQPDGRGRARRVSQRGSTSSIRTSRDATASDGRRRAAQRRDVRVLHGAAEGRRVDRRIARGAGIDEPAIVISSSGMATGGRVLHHLARALPDARNTVLFAGFQAAGTRGRQLKDGAKFTRSTARTCRSRARDRVDRLDVRARRRRTRSCAGCGGFTRPPKLTCLVHGEPGPMDALKARIERELKWTVKTPQPSREDDSSCLESMTIHDRRIFSNKSTTPPSCRYYADGFDALPLDQKILIWHLYQAALAGRDIYYDQRYRHALEMREVLEEILDARPTAVDAGRRSRRSAATRSSSGSTPGPHNNLTARKFVLDVHAGGVSRGRRMRPQRAARASLSRPARRSTTCSIASRRRSSTRRRRRSSPTRRRATGRDILDGQRQQPVRRRDDGRPRRIRRAVRPELAAREARRPPRRRGLPRRRPLRRARSRAIVGHLRDALPYAHARRCAQALEALIRFYETRRRRRPRGVRHRVGRRQGLAGRHDQRLHRELPGRARREGRVGSARLLRQPREDRGPAAAGGGRAVVRGADAVGSAVAARRTSTASPRAPSTSSSKPATPGR